MERYPSIGIGAHTSPNFRHEVTEALQKIDERPSGRRLLQEVEALSDHDKKVTIVEAGPGQAIVAKPRLTPAQWENLGSNPDQKTFDKALIKNASGSSAFSKRGVASEIPWSKHTAEPNLNEQGVPVEGANPEIAYVALAHEFTHAKHHLAGTLKYGGEVTRSASSASTPSGKEELRAVGLGKYANSGEPSENSIRQEHGLPLRRTYARSGNW
ncbi:XopG/HopH/AvrPtoH family type III secretion system effector [Pseudomonas coronafaciens]|uniref:XopG/HopH/AvrPtoH family type III secretion system effector n=1 Tax=Pseudomonas coronafaciens TaxID=53409 RepID=UPI000EFEE144|nr:XopG/HopH/AvrPtoH family type III secretion system effector [Pseudomonas coronafaciens]